MALSATSASAITVVKNCSSTVTKAPSLSGDNAVASDGNGAGTVFTTLLVDFRSRHVTVPRESTTTSMYANPIDDSMRVGTLFKYSVGPGPGPNGTQLMRLLLNNFQNSLFPNPVITISSSTHRIVVVAFSPRAPVGAGVMTSVAVASTLVAEASTLAAEAAKALEVAVASALVAEAAKALAAAATASAAVEIPWAVAAMGRAALEVGWAGRPPMWRMSTPFFP